MSANNAKVQAVIETTFNSAINKLAAVSYTHLTLPTIA